MTADTAEQFWLDANEMRHRAFGTDNRMSMTEVSMERRMQSRFMLAKAALISALQDMEAGSLMQDGAAELLRVLPDVFHDASLDDCKFWDSKIEAAS